jgi:hypothetical protein
MSAIATAFVISESDLPALIAAAKPVKRLLRKPIDRFPEFLASHARQLPVFTESGFLFTTVLVLLQERGIDLLQGAHAAQAEELQRTRGALLCIFFAPDQRSAYLPKLQNLSISAGELEQYFEAFTETSESGIGEALLLAIEYLRVVLAAVPDTGVVLFNIG